MSQVKVIADYGDLCGESPVWDPDNGCLYWTDNQAHRFYRYHQASNKHEVVKQGLEITGYSMNRTGGFVIANSRGIWLWDGVDDARLIADHIENTKCQMNDASADPEGRFFAGSVFYDTAKGV